MKKIFTFIVAAVITISFSVVGFAQDRRGPGADYPRGGVERHEKQVHKKYKKHHKKPKHYKRYNRTEGAAPSTEAAHA